MADMISREPETPELRILPLTIAGLICFLIAVTSGSGLWYLFGSKSPLRQKNEIVVAEPKTIEQAASPDFAVSPQSQSQPEANSNQPPAAPVEKTVPALGGELKVPSGEVVLGGGETGLPLRREFVADFAIAETEVTNAQFREFLEATAPEKAKAFKFGKEDEPVVNVSWEEANEYCKWLSGKLGVEVRLPSEAEWELAARGTAGNKYPWGHDWSDEAADSKEKNGKLTPVKSHPTNKSPFGAYDMAGNVWEWTSDESRDEFNRVIKYTGQNKAFENQIMRVVKGGSADESKQVISATARLGVPEGLKSGFVGFRYVVRRDKTVSNAGQNP